MHTGNSTLGLPNTEKAADRAMVSDNELFVGEQAEFHVLRSWDFKIGESRMFIQTLAWSFCRSCVPSDVGPGIWTNGKFLKQAPHNFANPVELPVVQCRVSKS